MATNVYIGEDINNPLFAFNDDNIISLVTHTAVNLMPQELTADTADIKVEYSGDEAIHEAEWATPVLIYNGSHLVGKFYLIDVKRVGVTQYEISATSVIGLLEYETFYGQKYSNASFKYLIENILLTNGFAVCRFYSSIRRGLFGEETDVSVNRRLQAVQIQTSVSSYPMNSKTEVNVKLNKFILNDLIYSTFQGQTSLRISLWGNCTTPRYDTLQTDQAASFRACRYGLFMDVSRESLEDIWPDYGEVFFTYGDNVYSLGTPTEPTDYDISVSPSDGTAIINGVTYTITNNHPDVQVYALAWCCGGVITGEHYVSGNLGTWAYAVCCDIEYGKYKLWNSDGNKLVDLIYTEDPLTKAPKAENIPASWTTGNINFSIFDRDNIVYDGGADEWAYNCRDNISYGGGVDNITVYGWIPPCTKREALHQLLLATGVIMKKDDDGNIVFTSPSTGDAIQLSSDNIYTDGKQDQLEHINRIEVTEHVFELGESSTSEIVFENYNQSNGIFVALYQKQPISSVSFSGLSILAASSNAALVMGVGTVTGALYKHTETVLHRDIGDRKDGKTISINDCTLISLPNSETVLDRLEAYYGNAYKIENSIILGDEKTGNLYSFMSPFRELVTGYLAKISSTFSNVTKAACEFICGYNPPQIGQDFTRWVILQGSGTWTVPESVFERDNPRIRIVLIGGGQGGSSGYAGEDGEDAKMGPTSTVTAKGGATGSPGSGGKIYTVDISDPSASYSFVCGEGGEGGAISNSHDTSNPGTAGGDTTFTDGVTTYSSISGESSESGVTNFFNGAKYAKQVIYYADGGDGGSIDWNKEGLDKRVAPGDVRLGLVKGEYALYNGAYYYNYAGQNGNDEGGSSVALGGCGGGAALTNEPGTVSGGQGGDATRSGSYYRAGDGGAGADATFTPIPALSINSTYWGYGGQGGAGGGGGGSSGTGSSGVVKGTGGKGGYGGVGGKGGNGCVLVYY